MPTIFDARLLGRVHVEDERDWSLQDLEEYRASVLTPTQVVKWLRAIIKWIESVIDPGPSPVPPPEPPPAPGAVLWADPVVLDQGDYGTCVGNGWAGWGDSAPTEDSYTETDARAIYYEATCIDGECDPSGQAGSTVRSGAKAMQNRKKLSAYAFLTYSEAKAKIAESPLVFGTDWTSGMFSPDLNGFIKPTGEVDGGHCYLALGYDPKADVWTFRNSWGTGWGLGGNFKMHGLDVQKLQDQQGEICLALELP